MIEYDTSQESETFRLIRYKARMNNETRGMLRLLLDNRFQMGASKAFDAFLHVYSGYDKFELLEKMKQYFNDEKKRWNDWDVKQEHQ